VVVVVPTARKVSVVPAVQEHPVKAILEEQQGLLLVVVVVVVQVEQVVLLQVIPELMVDWP
jgi:hypothetical protein